MTRITKGLLLAVAACALLGCDGDAGELCDLAIECNGGNDEDYDSCVTGHDAAEDEASACGCDEDYDAYVVCFLESNDCDNDVFGIDGQDCENEIEDVNDCIEKCTT